MGNDSAPRLVKLSRSEFEISNVDEDVRGRRVITLAGDPIGSVDDLLVDEEEKVVRFLEVGTGGFLGLGGGKSLIPIEAVSDVDQNHVFVDLTFEHIAAAPLHNPHVVQTGSYLNDIYEHYGYQPPWTPGAETS